MSHTDANWKTQPYRGFEQGPIRPPSEAGSLLIRVTRNCPWNRCTFCPVYKRSAFSLRPTGHVIEDIDRVAGYLDALCARTNGDGHLPPALLADAYHSLPCGDEAAFRAAVQWRGGEMTSIFLQDANSLIMPPAELLTILGHLKARFPGVERVTSYARSRTVDRIGEAALTAMRAVGLGRIHIGMESGSDAVLKMVKKGSTQEVHVRAGRRIKAAGMSLSEYVMPGLGGRVLSRAHAIETAEALNRIDPDFIRLRSLAVPAGIPLHQDLVAGRFAKCGDVETAREIRLMISRLEGIASRIRSDHILNLFEEIDGQMPTDQPAMLAVLDGFLGLPSAEQVLFQVGRRVGIFRRLRDMGDGHRRDQVEELCRRNGITPENVDVVIDRIMTQFI